jgi:glycosyltransferase involved in cell wall biosynthesis
MGRSEREAAEASRPWILFVNAHYHPDVASTGQHLTDLAEYLAAEGMRISVLTSRGRYVAGKVEAPAFEVRNGVEITRARATTFGRGSHLGRLVDYASFYLQVLLRLLGGGRPDGVVFLTTPPLLSFVGRLARLLRRQRYAIWSMDLHPDAEFAAGMLDPRGLAGRLLEWANATGYRGADFVVDLGAYMKERLLAKGVRRERTRTIHVWSRVEEIEPTPRRDNPLVDELGLRDRFVVMYSGNAGIVHDFSAVLEAMRRLRDDPRVYFLFVGGGPQRPAIEEFAREHSIGNFAYRDYFPRDQLRFSLAVADAHLITLRAPFAGIAVPGKLYGIMASGRPAIFVGPERSDSAEAIRAGHCGVVIDPGLGGDAAARLTDVVRAWAADPAPARALGEAGRAEFLDRYERVPNCRAFADVIEHTWGRVPTREGLRAGEPRPDDHRQGEAAVVGSRPTD